MNHASLASKVLLVDDDAGVRRAYARALRQFGYAVDSAPSAKAVMETMDPAAYDLILSDICMPEMGGLSFLRALRERDVHTPVVLMTGEPGLEPGAQPGDHEASPCLLKPVGLDRLAEVVRSVLTARQSSLPVTPMLLGAEEDAPTDSMLFDPSKDPLDRAIERLWMAFQPIVCYSERRVVGFEALVRSDDEVLNGPAALLEAAEKLGRIHDLGRAVRRTVAAVATHSPEDVSLFVNLHSFDLRDPELYSPAAPLSAIASRVVLEITERCALEGSSELEAHIAQLRKLGFRIAIDDLGAGYAGLSSFVAIEPDVVKLDRSLVSGIDQAPKKRSVVTKMVELFRGELGLEVISEGVETAAEREALLSAGCEWLQGYLFARPARGFPAPAW